MLFRSLTLCLLASTGSLALSTAAQAEGRSIIVLDGSGSMWGQIDGRPKLEIAREALGQVLSSIPPETELGLMAYGHRSKGDCGNIELVVPPAAGSAGAISAAANSMKFLGKTPLSDAVRRAAAELRSTEAKATVILITDGIETCEADPCAVATELEQQGIDFTAHVVGFGLTAEEGQQVACLAQNTGGQYIEAKDAGSLVEALKTTVVQAEPEPAPAPVPEPAPAPAVLEQNVDPQIYLAQGGPELTDGLLADAVFEFRPVLADGSTSSDWTTIYGAMTGALPPGKYMMTARIHSAHQTVPVEIGPQTELSKPAATLDAGILNLTLRASPGAEPDKDAFWEMFGPDDVRESGYTKALRMFPAGEYSMNVKLGAGETSRTVVIEAGKTTDLDVVLGVGHAVIDAFYTEGLKSEADQFVEILSAAQDIEGNRKQFGYAYGPNAGFDLPPGDYIARVTLGGTIAEAPLVVKSGERTALAVALNAGVAAFTSPGDQHIEVLSATKDITGQRKSLAYGYGPNWQTTLPAGDYVVKMEGGGVLSETPMTVKAGERIELTLAP
ncbi:vWA domain-containing protein [Gemmobacter serpentinus]|uniref:vWA domain-containing protein n=1 Tax=Gemmobacter serpentinus TaxID=2652247 RepID=UPI00186573FD|nr:VWA domain-containing protein [Gemmobacter serpentinus]